MKMIRLISPALVCVVATTIHAQSYRVLADFNGTYSPYESGIIAQSRGGTCSAPQSMPSLTSLEWPSESRPREL
jgi:hypothetical protein